MRKIGRIGALILALVLITGMAAAESAGAPDYILEGVDGEDTGRSWESNMFFERMREKTGIRFVFRQADGYTAWERRVEQLAKKENLPDVLFKASLTAGEVRDWYEAGILIDLAPYLEQYAPDLWALLEAHPDWKKAITLENGAIAALPNLNTIQNNDLMWINQEWLKRVNMDMPTTAEELTEVLRAFKAKDPNRNGRADEVPLTFIGMWELRFLGHAFGIVDNDDYVRVKDGTVTSALTSTENRAFLTWLHQLWEEELLDRKGFFNTDNLRQITDEKATIPYGMMLGPTPLSVVPTSAMDQYTALEPLMYSGERIYRSLLGDVIRGTFAITRECKEPERLLTWVNTLYTEEGSRLAQCGQEGEDYVWNEDGWWEWNEDMSTVANVILPTHTISEGGVFPGITSAEFQLKYAETAARSSIEQIVKIGQYAVYPYPYVTLSREDEARANAIRAELSPWAEEAMACFVTGDTELNDVNWEAFRQTAEEKGLNELISLLAKYI